MEAGLLEGGQAAHHLTHEPLEPAQSASQPENVSTAEPEEQLQRARLQRVVEAKLVEREVAAVTTVEAVPVSPDAAVVHNLVEMGFRGSDAEAAVHAVGSDLDAALEHVMSREAEREAGGRSVPAVCEMPQATVCIEALPALPGEVSLEAELSKISVADAHWEHPQDQVSLKSATWEQAGSSDEEDPARAEGQFGEPMLTAGDFNGQGKWVGDDMEERISFMEILAERRLPMPQNEGQFHASRMFIDAENRSRYSVEQWLDYLQLHGYSLKDLSANAVDTQRSQTTAERSSPATSESARQFKAMSEYAQSFRGSVHFIRQTWREEVPALVVVHKQLAWYTVRLITLTSQGLMIAELLKRCMSEAGALEWAAEA